MVHRKSTTVQCNTCGKWLSAVLPVRCCGVVILDKFRKKDKMERLKWYFKQILPLVYVSTFTEVIAESKEEIRRLCIWRMWLGRSFNVRHFDLAS